MKPYITILLALALCASAASCGGNASADDTGTSANDTTTIDAGPFNIPPENNGGRTFNIIIPTHTEYEYPDEATGELVNDTLFERATKVEEHFGINLTYQYELGHYIDRASYNNFIISAVMAGDSTYDMATGLLSCTVPIFLNGVFTDLNSCPDLDLDNPWWLKNLSQDLSIRGKLYCAIGDANLSLYKTAVVTYFNKALLDEYQLEDPYELVRQDKWTIGKMFEMAEVAMADLNGDTIIRYKDDRLGCYLQDVPLRLAGCAFDVNLFGTDADGNVFRDTDGIERLLYAYDFTKLFHTEDYLHDDEGGDDMFEIAKHFIEDRSLFHISYLQITEGEGMRSMKSDFGIVPYPKLDENQPNHITPIGTATNLMFIPKTASDIDLTCRVMEALGYYSMTDVVPAYYEVALRDKYTRDEEVPEMLEIIRETMRLPFDCCYGSTIQDHSGTSNPGALLSWARKDMASFYESKTAAWDEAVKKINEFE
ncbi:MAG: hypothetical protein E7632_11110 [Ruminococcaceae bacterium]|nr:hypothetical protein [Oscillospiraceae bacterium]